jgi:hypothetical protein
MGTADRDLVPGHGSFDSRAGAFGDIFGKVEGQASTVGLVKDRFREHMRGELVDRGGHSHELVRSDPGLFVEDLNAVDGRCPDRERAGLVDQHRAGLAESFDHVGALDDHASAGGA